MATFTALTWIENAVAAGSGLTNMMTATLPRCAVGGNTCK